MKKLADEHGFQFDLDAKELERRCSGRRSVTKVLSQWLHEKQLPELDKPELGENLALILEEEIRENKRREETEPEMVVKKIVTLSEIEKVSHKNSHILVKEIFEELDRATKSWASRIRDSRAQ